MTRLYYCWQISKLYSISMNTHIVTACYRLYLLNDEQCIYLQSDVGQSHACCHSCTYNYLQNVFHQGGWFYMIQLIPTPVTPCYVAKKVISSLSTFQHTKCCQTKSSVPDFLLCYKVCKDLKCLLLNSTQWIDTVVLWTIYGILHLKEFMFAVL